MSSTMAPTKFTELIRNYLEVFQKQELNPSQNPDALKKCQTFFTQDCAHDVSARGMMHDSGRAKLSITFTVSTSL